MNHFNKDVCQTRDFVVPKGIQSASGRLTLKLEKVYHQGYFPNMVYRNINSLDFHMEKTNYFHSVYIYKILERPSQNRIVISSKDNWGLCSIKWVCLFTSVRAPQIHGKKDTWKSQKNIPKSQKIVRNHRKTPWIHRKLSEIAEICKKSLKTTWPMYTFFHFLPYLIVKLLII